MEIVERRKKKGVLNTPRAAIWSRETYTGRLAFFGQHMNPIEPSIFTLCDALFVTAIMMQFSFHNSISTIEGIEP